MRPCQGRGLWDRAPSISLIYKQLYRIDSLMVKFGTSNAMSTDRNRLGALHFLICQFLLKN